MGAPGVEADTAPVTAHKSRVGWPILRQQGSLGARGLTGADESDEDEQGKLKLMTQEANWGVCLLCRLAATLWSRKIQVFLRG